MGTGVTLPIQSPETEVKQLSLCVSPTGLAFRGRPGGLLCSKTLIKIKLKSLTTEYTVYFPRAAFSKKLLVNKFYGQALGQLVLVN